MLDAVLYGVCLNNLRRVNIVAEVGRQRKLVRKISQQFFGAAGVALMTVHYCRRRIKVFFVRKLQNGFKRRKRLKAEFRQKPEIMIAVIFKRSSVLPRVPIMAVPVILVFGTEKTAAAAGRTWPIKDVRRVLFHYRGNITLVQFKILLTSEFCAGIQISLRMVVDPRLHFVVARKKGERRVGTQSYDVLYKFVAAIFAELFRKRDLSAGKHKVLPH